MYTQEMDLIDKVLEAQKRVGINIKDLAAKVNVSRPLLSQYLNRKYASDATKLEEDLQAWLDEANGTGAVQMEAVRMLQKTDCYESQDYASIIGICQLCQQEAARGIITGRSGYGKTFSLRKYAQMPRVAYIECNEAMNQRDLVRRIEQAIGLPTTSGSIAEHLERVADLFNTASGYLLIIDEADKLISKYSQKKIELLRAISDMAHVGIVIAGEPVLEGLIKSYDPRLANRMEFGYKLRGLSEKEVRNYFKGYEVEDAAMAELVLRACNKQTGCFRLFDRTINNVIRILQERGETKVTMKVVREASRMMLL